MVISGRGLGQVRTVTSRAENTAVVEIDEPLSTALDESSIVTIAPWVGRWLVAGNFFTNGTSVQTYGMTLGAVFVDNDLHNMTKSAQVTPAGICLTSLQYGSGVMANVYFEVLKNTGKFFEGIHIRASEINGTTLTYGFAIRQNRFAAPPPLPYLDNGSGAQITLSSGCTAGVVESNSLEDPYRKGSRAIKVDPGAAVVVRGNHVIETEAQP